MQTTPRPIPRDLRKIQAKRGLLYLHQTISRLEDRLVQEPFEGPRVFGCIFEADKAQVDAANTLLKLVEEPPSHALILFATEFRLKILHTPPPFVPVPVCSVGIPQSRTLESYFMEEFVSPEAAREAVEMAKDADIQPAQALERFHAEIAKGLSGHV
ncbi:MAG: hypothetical protein IPI28_00025 [Candidatus Omnitrophica bacterium]|nr:hypothetical protein [Candidatus Omnitrophota bacterium]